MNDQDITTLRESEERFRAMADGIPAMIWVSDAEGHARFINRAYEEFHGITLEDLKERGWQSLIHPDDLTAYAAEVTACLRDRRCLQAQVRVKRRDGEWRWVECVAQPRVSSRGELLGFAGVSLDITHRLALEQAVRLNEERHRLALRGSPVAVWECDSDLRFTFLDNLQPPLTEPAQIIGKRDDEILPIEYVRELIAIKKRVLATGVGERAELEFPAGNRRFYFEMVVEPISNSNGTVAGLRGLAIEISERKRSEEILRSVSSELAHTLHIAAVGLTHCSRDLRYLSANPAYARYVGLSREQIVGRPIVDVLGHAAFEVIRPRIERVLRGETVEYEDELPLGAVRKWARVAYTPDHDASGNVVGWVASVMDITERKQAEDAARQQAALLRFSFDAIIVWRFDRGIESWNRGAETLYGFTESEAIGHRTHDLLNTIFPVSCSETERVLKNEGKWEGELRHRTKDGRYVTVSTRLQCISGDDGSIRILETNRDISDRKRLEQQLAEDGRRKDEFLSLLGHELRNPLATITTAAQLLSSGVPDAQRVSLNGMMNRQLELMRRLLDDLLDLGRITHGHIQLKKLSIELAQFLLRIADVTRPTTVERGQELILRLPSEVVTFKADEARVEQVVINLLNNASKYTAKGGRIELSGAREDSEVVFRCKDNGRGIPPEMQQKIFDPFNRVDPFSDGHGEASLGIGLALVKRLVELHGGTVTVTSSGLGMGSEFAVRLPLEPAPPDQSAVPEVNPVSTSRRSRLIVVVEDNSDFAGALVIALEQAGYQVARFADAVSALARISELTPHAVLLDIGLPGMDGYTLAAMLRQHRHLDHTVFVGLSGFKRCEPGESGDSFDYFFNKPVDLPTLFTVLDAPARSEEPTPSPRPVLERVESPRVLLVDDHAELTTVTAAFLRNEGLEVRSALSGQESLAIARDFKPQLTLCDLHLPDMSGLEVIRRLRSNPLTRQTYAVVVTALSEGQIRDLNDDARQMGVDEFVSKPLTRDVVRTLVTNLKRQTV